MYCPVLSEKFMNQLYFVGYSLVILVNAEDDFHTVGLSCLDLLSSFVQILIYLDLPGSKGKFAARKRCHISFVLSDSWDMGGIMNQNPDFCIPMPRPQFTSSLSNWC